jgi:hypothetical protein
MQHLHIYTKQVKLIISKYTPASQKHSDKMNHSKAVWGVPMVKKKSNLEWQKCPNQHYLSLHLLISHALSQKTNCIFQTNIVLGTWAGKTITCHISSDHSKHDNHKIFIKKPKCNLRYLFAWEMIDHHFIPRVHMITINIGIGIINSLFKK